MTEELYANQVTYREAAAQDEEPHLTCGYIQLVFMVICGLLLGISEVPAQDNAAGGVKRVIVGADMAYYFTDKGIYVAAEGLVGKPRSIIESKDHAAEDGMNLIMKSTCMARGDVPEFSGQTELVGRATTVVYASTGPTHLIILGIEDLTKVGSRKFIPLKPIDPRNGGACCCQLRRGADSIIYCPCGSNC